MYYYHRNSEGKRQVLAQDFWLFYMSDRKRQIPGTNLVLNLPYILLVSGVYQP